MGEPPEARARCRSVAPVPEGPASAGPACTHCNLRHPIFDDCLTTSPGCCFFGNPRELALSLSAVDLAAVTTGHNVGPPAGRHLCRCTHRQRPACCVQRTVLPRTPVIWSLLRCRAPPTCPWLQLQTPLAFPNLPQGCDTTQHSNAPARPSSRLTHKLFIHLARLRNLQTSHSHAHTRTLLPPCICLCAPTICHPRALRPTGDGATLASVCHAALCLSSTSSLNRQGQN